MHIGRRALLTSMLVAPLAGRSNLSVGQTIHVNINGAQIIASTRQFEMAVATAVLQAIERGKPHV